MTRVLTKVVIRVTLNTSWKTITIGRTMAPVSLQSKESTLKQIILPTLWKDLKQYENDNYY